MAILRSQNKNTDVLMIVALLCRFKLVARLPIHNCKVLLAKKTYNRPTVQHSQGYQTDLK